MRARRIAAGLLVLTAILTAAAGHDATGQSLSVQVQYGPGGGPERFRIDFGDALLLELRSRGCYGPILDNDDGDVLLFRVVLEAPVEEHLNDLSITGSLRNETERGTSSATSRIRVYADMEILLPGSRELFREKRIRGEASYRPIFAWEDGSAEARDELISGFASQVAGYACKANGKKLRKRLDGPIPEKSPVR